MVVVVVAAATQGGAGERQPPPPCRFAANVGGGARLGAHSVSLEKS